MDGNRNSETEIQHIPDYQPGILEVLWENTDQLLSADKYLETSSDST